MSSFVPGAVGDSQPILKCNAKSGRFTVDNVSVTKIQFVADLENAEAGWMRFGENMSPDFKMVKVRDLLAGAPYPPPPEVRDKDGKLVYRRGFRMMVKIGDKLAGGKPSVRELASNSLCVTTALDGLFRAYYEDGHRKPGKLPVVAVEEWIEVKGAHGSNFQPQFLIKRMVDRPADLKDDGSTSPLKSQVEGAPSHVTDVTGELEAIDEDAPEDFSEFEAA
jgi:hypothetical protein